MCSRYQPAAPHSLSRWDLPPPDFAYGEAYPGMAVTIEMLTSAQESLQEENAQVPSPADAAPPCATQQPH